MANHGITGSITIGSGQTFANAVVRVVEFGALSTDVVDTSTFYVRVMIWRTETSYDNGEEPIEKPGCYNAIDSDFTTYFAKSVLNQAGKDPYVASYLYLKNEVARFSGFTNV